jgi:exosortase
MLEAYSPSPSTDDGHGLFVPILVLGLMWWKRKELLGSAIKIWMPALGLLVLAMMMHIMGYVLQQPRISIVALFAGIYAMMGLAWGKEWLRKSAFPFVLFIFCVPLAGQASYITVPLQNLVSWLVELVSHVALGIPVIRQGNQLYDPSGTYKYEVAAACSGIRSLISIFLIATTYGFVAFRSRWQRLFFMSLAFPFAVLGNLVRMLCIIIAAAIGGQKYGDWVHDNGLISLVPYVPAIIGLLFIGDRIERREKRIHREKEKLRAHREKQEKFESTANSQKLEKPDVQDKAVPENAEPGQKLEAQS